MARHKVSIEKIPGYVCSLSNIGNTTQLYGDYDNRIYRIYISLVAWDIWGDKELPNYIGIEKSTTKTDPTGVVDLYYP